MNRVILPTRRLVVGGALTALVAGKAFAAETVAGPRFIVILLRGGMDGLMFAPPVGDARLADLREPMEGAVRLNSFFALHPSLPTVRKLYEAGDLIVAHAVGTPYKDRSHFDAQNVLESGGEQPDDLATGWLARFVQAMERQGKFKPNGPILSVGPTPPFIVRGASAVSGLPSTSQQTANTSLTAAVLNLYQNTDALLYAPLAEAVALQSMTSKAGDMSSGDSEAGIVRQTARNVARLLLPADGMRVAVMSIKGWDTHFSQALQWRKPAQSLDDALDEMRRELDPVWSDTTIVVATEFGRTVALNGALGADHGWASVALLAGGRVKGGRVIADWPGLDPSSLREGRDLRMTTDLRGMLKGVALEGCGLSEASVEDGVFPKSRGVSPRIGLFCAN